jgi:tight adherence protein B
VKRLLRRRASILAGSLALAVVLPHAASAAVRLQGVDASGYPTIRMSVVTSKPSKQPPVLTENGRPVVGLQTTNLGLAKSVVLAVDISQSMRGRPLTRAVEAAQAFIRTKRPGDRIAVTTFATKAIMLTGFSSSNIDTDAALGTIHVDPVQGTKLYDDLVLAALNLSAEPPAGRVILVVTDGNETRSEATLADVVAAARTARASIYVVGIESSRFTPKPLQEIAAATGGRYYAAASSAELAKVYSGIARELLRTWQVEYLTAARPGDALKLAVTVPKLGASTTSLTLPGSSETPVGALLPAWLTSNVLSTFGLALIIGTFVLVAAFSLMATREGAWVKSRLEPHIADTAAQRNQRGKGVRFSGFKQLVKGTDEAFAHLKHWKAIRLLLERADIPLRPAEFVYISGGAGLGLGLLVALSGASPIAILIFMCLGGSLPLAWAWFKAGRRLKAFENQLPDILITVAASLKAGHSFRQGLQSVVEEGQPPASKEFKRVLTETRLGRPMDEALQAMGERVGSNNLDFVITAVTIQRQVGGSLAGLFDMVADAVRQRQQFQRKIKGLTAMGRMSAYVLIGLPFFVAFCLTILNAEYMSPLFHTSTGHKLIGLGLGMMLVGSAVLKKMVSFKG